MNYDDIVVLIPAYKPDERLIKLVDDLIAAGFRRIVTVDDGGGSAFAHIFDSIRDKALVLTHEVNRGKGAALKTGLAEIARTPCTGVITADCDGQHTPADIARVADALMREPDALILGSRDKSAMPPRSKAGNTLTCGVFKLLTGVYLSDTQTGLRGLPFAQLNEWKKLDGDRYEYEINMLMDATKRSVAIREVTIETIYIDNNAASHFNAVKDGLRIYGLMFRQAGKFAASSVLCALVDFLLFSILVYAAHWAVIPSQIAARVVSALVNYALNSLVVFGRKLSGKSFLRYVMLAAFILGCSCIGHFILQQIHTPAILAKIIVDGLLYIVSYKLQRTHVFAQE